MHRRETERLLIAIRQAQAAAERVAIATVVRVKGSAYRREGTRMLVRHDGTYECALSGGCLEPWLDTQFHATSTTAPMPATTSASHVRTVDACCASLPAGS